MTPEEGDLEESAVKGTLVKLQSNSALNIQREINRLIKQWKKALEDCLSSPYHFFPLLHTNGFCCPLLIVKAVILPTPVLALTNVPVPPVALRRKAIKVLYEGLVKASPEQPDTEKVAHLAVQAEFGNENFLSLPTFS